MTLHGIDVALFRAINNWPEWLSPLFFFLSEATKITPGRIFLAILGVFLLSRKTTRTATLLGLLAFLIANGLTEALKTAVFMDRPCVELADVHLRVGLLTSHGTASSHAGNTAAFATVFFLAFGWKAWPAIAIAVGTGISRLYVGVHYPSQVLLGWICGMLCGLIAWYTFESFTEMRKTRASSVENRS